jgi:hypothetical protein
MAKVKLRAGFGEHYIQGKEGIVEVKPGDVVNLSESQMAAFGDKFEPATGRRSGKARVPKVKADEDGSDGEGDGSDADIGDQDDGGDHQHDLKG